MNTRYALRPSTDLPIIYLYRAAVDFRKSHRGLSAIVQMELGHDPFTGVLYVFRNRAFNKLKILFWGVPRRSCELRRPIIDGSRPPEIGVQAQISNRRVLLYLRDMVVSNVGNGIVKDVRYVLGR